MHQILLFWKRTGLPARISLILSVFLFWFLRIWYWHITFEQPFSDMAGYMHIAVNILKHWDFSWDPFWKAYKGPTHGFLAAGVFLFFGAGNLAAWRFFQAAVVFSGLLWAAREISLCTRRQWIGIALIWTVALSRSSIFWSLKFAYESLGEGFSYLCLASMIWALRSMRKTAFFTSGVLLTVLSLLRPQSFILLPGFILGALALRLIYTYGSRSPFWFFHKRLPQLVTFIAGVGLIWSPWIIRNYRIYGHFVPVTTQSPYSFLWELGAVKVHRPDGRTEIKTVNDLTREASKNFSSDYEASKFANQVAMNWLRENRRFYLKLIRNRIENTLLVHDESLTTVSRFKLLPGHWNQLLVHKSTVTVLLGLAGLIAFTFFSPVELFTVPLVALGPWLVGILFFGYPRLLDPALPLMLFGNVTWVALLAYVSKSSRNFYRTIRARRNLVRTFPSVL